jgi:hypothetical protein
LVWLGINISISKWIDLAGQSLLTYLWKWSERFTGHSNIWKISHRSLWIFSDLMDCRMSQQGERISYAAKLYSFSLLTQSNVLKNLHLEA